MSRSSSWHRAIKCLRDLYLPVYYRDRHDGELGGFLSVSCQSVDYAVIYTVLVLQELES